MPAEDGPPRKRHRHDYTNTITVLVGQSENEFTIHEQVITHRSEFFQAACNGKFKEGKEKVVRLPEVELDAFKSYMHWVYSDTVVVNEDSKPPPKSQSTFIELAKLYAVGDVLGDMCLRNAVIDRMIVEGQSPNLFPGLDTVNIAYHQTPEGSTLRKLILDWCIASPFPIYFKEYARRFSVEFLIDFVQNKMESKGEKGSEITIKDKCRYHEHKEGVTRCSS